MPAPAAVRGVEINSRETNGPEVRKSERPEGNTSRELRVGRNTDDQIMDRY